MNPKFKILNPPSSDPVAQRTVVVIGLARSGTSFVASTLNYLGCFMGENATRASVEDIVLSKAMEDCDDQRFQEIVSGYNIHHDIWGFKRPNIILHWKRIEPFLRNPFYIVTHRDPFAVALRNEISIGRDIPASLSLSAKASVHMLDFIVSSKRPSLHLSYELIMSDSLAAAVAIRDFVFPVETAKQIDAKHYLEAINAHHNTYLLRANSLVN